MNLSIQMTHAFDGFTLDIDATAPSGLTVLFGQSGSGKSTVINAVAGLLTPDKGRIAIGETLLLDTARGINLPPHKRRVGYIFQDARLFPHLSVAQNLAYGRRFAKDRNLPEQGPIIDMLGLGTLLERRPQGLSGGEKQRVAIGRALMSAPDVILADEPLAALDATRKADILPYFERLRDEVSVPILYVSHSATEVARLATSVIALEDGRVSRQGNATEVLGDPSVTPAGIREVGAVLQARVTRHHEDGLTELDAGGVALFLPKLDQALGSALRVRIPAQDVLLSLKQPDGLSALNTLSGTVTAIRRGEGPGAIVSLETAAGLVLARITRRSADALRLSEGTSCYAIIKSVAIAPGDVSG